MTTRSINGDEHYGHIGFGSMDMSGADVFSSILLDAIIEPDIILSHDQDENSLDISIDNILVWDVEEWFPQVNTTYDIVGAEAKVQSIQGGLTKDNTGDASNGPTAELRTQGANAGGNRAAVTGTAGVLDAARTSADEVTQFEEYWDFGIIGNEENATGEINMTGLQRTPLNNTRKSPYEIDGNTVHKMLTAAHYWMWLNTAGIGSAMTLGLGASVRKYSVDVQELMFDRAVLITLSSALSLHT